MIHAKPDLAAQLRFGSYATTDFAPPHHQNDPGLARCCNAISRICYRCRPIRPRNSCLSAVVSGGTKPPSEKLPVRRGLRRNEAPFLPVRRGLRRNEIRKFFRIRWAGFFAVAEYTR